MINWQMLITFLLAFLPVAILGFFAAHWRSGDLNRLQEWGLAGRRFGIVATFCLLGGTVYTADALVAIPGLFFGQGALGYYITAQAIFMFPFVTMVIPKFWTIARHRGYITVADFVRDRFNSRFLALLVALTGILATMPYLALQIFGMEVCLAQMGVPLNVSVWIAFGFLAIYTFNGGLRAPAIISFAKIVLIWLTGIVAVWIILGKLGGIHHVLQTVPPSHILLFPLQYSSYLSLAIGAAFSLFLYPHCLTGVLSANGQKTVRYSFLLISVFTILLCIFDLFGFMAISAGIKLSPTYGFNAAVPMLFAKMLPPEMAGVAFAALSVSALVPAAVMSIATANLFTRNIYRAYFRPSCNEREEVNAARIASLLVKAGAFVFLLFSLTFVNNLQLLGSIWMLQTIPIVLIGLYTNKLHRYALVVGWAGGMIFGTLVAVKQNFNLLYVVNFGTNATPIYVGLIALGINLVLSIALTPVFHAIGLDAGYDETRPADFEIQPVVPLQAFYSSRMVRRNTQPSFSENPTGPQPSLTREH